MNRIVITSLCMLCAFAISATAADGKKKGTKMTDEQKTMHKQMVEKYDADKNGKLDKEERAKMSAEDKKAMEKLFPKKGKEGKKDKK